MNFYHNIISFYTKRLLNVFLMTCIITVPVSVKEINDFTYDYRHPILHGGIGEAVLVGGRQGLGLGIAAHFGNRNQFWVLKKSCQNPNAILGQSLAISCRNAREVFSSALFCFCPLRFIDSSQMSQNRQTCGHKIFTSNTLSMLNM